MTLREAIPGQAEEAGEERAGAEERRASAGIVVCFLSASGCGAGMIWAYWYTDNIGWMGGLGGSALILMAVGLTLWAHHLLPNGPFHEEYPELRSPPEKEAEVLATLDRGAVGRRRLLLGSLGLAGTAVVGGVASTVRSWGPAPASFAGSPWRAGRPLVDQDGKAVTGDELEVGAALGVFPQGFIDEPDSPCILIRLPPGANRPLKGRSSWAPDGYVCYSKVCTHAGCAVNMYDRRAMILMCPCHQSSFDVRNGAEPFFGPAVDPLPQLPLKIAPDGTFHAAGELSHPPGPMYWHYVPGVGT